MSVKRRLAAAGMPAAGVTVFAVLALTGQPASAASVDSSAVSVAQRAAVATPNPTCDQSARVKCGYGDSDDSSSGNGPAVSNDDSTNDSDDNDTAGNAGADNGSATDDADDTRGGDDGYGGVSPSTSPTATPTPTRTSPNGGKDEVPGGEAPETVSPTGSSHEVDTLPVTGPSVSVITTVGALLAAAGAAIMVGMRRRRSA